MCVCSARYSSAPAIGAGNAPSVLNKSIQSAPGRRANLETGEVVDAADRLRAGGYLPHSVVPDPVERDQPLRGDKNGSLHRGRRFGVRRVSALAR
jgi:hypothetical protein